jgi:hypothetical protein
MDKTQIPNANPCQRGGFCFQKHPLHFQSTQRAKRTQPPYECRAIYKVGDAPPAVHFCEPNAPKRDQPHTSKATNQKESER